ncbi:MAG: DUF2723 domain-containing protein [Caldilineaceae bacterium]
MPVNRTDRQIVWLLFAFTLGLYLRTLSPGLLGGDSGEFQFAAWRLGLAHPTGYPFYLLLGSAWQHLWVLVGFSPATTMNALSAVFGALAVALLYLIMLDWLQGPVTIRRTAALFTAVLFGVNPTFWSQNLIAEVYTLHALFILLIFRTVQLTRSDDFSRSTQPTTKVVTTKAPYFIFFLVGLALTHHGMTLFLVPGLLLALWILDRQWCYSLRHLLLAGLATLAPLLLYLYIPLRSGPVASPWYHQPFGAGRLDLYQNTWPAFLNFITGRSISVGFHSVDQALSTLPQAWLLWRLHFNWPGIVLLLLGLGLLVRQRRWSVLALTLTYALIQQVFNLFYAIGDILVYYIPLYLMGAIWAGFAANALGSGQWQAVGKAQTPAMDPAPETPAAEVASANQTATPPLVGLFLVIALFLLPLYLGTTYFPQLDQSGNQAPHQQWESILAAKPPANAILISNDRDEIAPLFYLQVVEQRGRGFTGLFPLLTPEPRFRDIGATIETALAQANGRPVYLIKPMPGLEVKFALEPATAPLVKVSGAAAQGAPQYWVKQTFGPLQLSGYDWQPVNNSVRITLHWQVQAQLPADYTTTVQLFDAQGEKLAQADQPPGGVYYPTTLWKPGETLLDSHTLTLPAARPPATLLVGMYVGSDFKPLAPPLKLALAVK